MTEREFWQGEIAAMPCDFLSHLIEVSRGLGDGEDFVRKVAAKLGCSDDEELEYLKVPFQFEEVSSCPPNHKT